jgi:hypothetical protein
VTERGLITAAGVAGCAGIVAATSGVGGAVCGFLIGFGGGVSTGSGCGARYDACILAIPDKCPQCQ